jgi:hypothetical protein
MIPKVKELKLIAIYDQILIKYRNKLYNDHSFLFDK